MRHMSLSSLAVLTLLSLSAPALAEDTTGAEAITAQLVTQARATPPTLSTPAPALEQAPTIPGEVSLDEVLKLVSQAVASRNWGVLACAVVLAAVYLVRRTLKERIPWLKSDMAGVVLSVVTAATLSVSAALAAGQALSASLLLGALFTAAGASGLWSWGRKVKASLTPAPAR